MKKPYTATPLRFAGHFLVPYRVNIIFYVLGLLLTSILSYGGPWVFAKIIDIVAHTDQLTAHKVFMWLGILGGVEITHLIFLRGSNLIYNRVCPEIQKAVVEETMPYILKHAPAYLTQYPIGKLSHRVDQLSHEVEHLLDFLFGWVSRSLKILVPIVYLGLLSPYFLAVILFWGTILGIYFRKSSAIVERDSSACAEIDSTVHGGLIDVLNNWSLVKSFGNLAYEKKKMAPLLQQKRDVTWTFYKHIELTRFFQLGISILFKLSMLGLALYEYLNGRITVGTIVLILTLQDGIHQAFYTIVFSMLDWYRIIGHLKNALKIVQEPHAIVDAKGAKNVHFKTGHIVFDHITFGYQPGKPVFNDFSLTIKPGERVGLVGVSGSGKSTLIALLQRFYIPWQGHIYFNKTDLSTITLDSLHQNISLIPQDTSLFHRTLKENIAYGKPDATDKEIMRAGKLASAHNFIMDTEHGYDSLVGDRGIKLSGGQRQRIAIARAILKKAPVLILDEATSSLDSVSEQAIQKSLKNLMRGKTVIAIAHRLSTLKEMDRIVVLSKGRIVEQGRPADLLKKKGKYAKLWKLQTMPAAAPETDKKDFPA